MRMYARRVHAEYPIPRQTIPPQTIPPTSFQHQSPPQLTGAESQAHDLKATVLQLDLEMKSHALEQEEAHQVRAEAARAAANRAEEAERTLAEVRLQAQEEALQCAAAKAAGEATTAFLQTAESRAREMTAELQRRQEEHVVQAKEVAKLREQMADVETNASAMQVEREARVLAAQAEMETRVMAAQVGMGWRGGMGKMALLNGERRD